MDPRSEDAARSRDRRLPRRGLVQAGALGLPLTALAGRRALAGEATPTATDGDHHPAKARALYDLLDARPFDGGAMAALFAADFVDNNRPEGDPSPSDREATLVFLAALANGFPDARHEIVVLEPVADDGVLVHWRFRGSHRNAFFGEDPRGNRVDMFGFDLWRFRDGLIVEQWHVEELIKLFAQIRA